MGEPLDLDAIQARADAATPGPWEPGGGAGVWLLRDNLADPDIHIATCYCGDAVFIAHARTDVPALVAALREARQAAWDARKLIADGPYMAPEVYEPARTAVLQRLNGLLRLTGDKA